MTEEVEREIKRRRTFAIISHPDAGKTTLTEKLLLYGGALRLAGSVTARKKQRDTASDWMELEKKRGISISSTVLQFEYENFHLNLLDTPGHKDFSEDTYRVLMAVDAVIMVIDSGKGIEEQTRKLFEICRKRKIPLFTFMNKLDRPGQSPLALIDEVENVLGIHAFPVNWPLGMGMDFKGVYDRRSRKAYLFDRVVGGASRAPVSVHGISDPQMETLLGSTAYQTAVEEIELLDEAHAKFDPESVLRGETTPVFFGSAANNFGVELLLKGFLDHSAPPQSRYASSGKVDAVRDPFSGFIFKIQANANPQHRDQIAFLRVCSGKFERGKAVCHTRTGKFFKLSNSHNVFGQDREVVDVAYPGDIIGIVGQDEFKIGDTLSDKPSIHYHEIPQFAPECFAYLSNPNPAKYKPFRKGLELLLLENIVQVFTIADSARGPLFGAVGPLQFEVLQYRLKSEYGADSQLEMMPWSLMRWANLPPDSKSLQEIKPHGGQVGWDSEERSVIFFPSKWGMKHFSEENPNVELLDIQETVLSKVETQKEI